MTRPLALLILVLLWLFLSTVGGALLALLARRLHPSLSLKRLWMLYTVLLGVTVAAVLAIASR